MKISIRIMHHGTRRMPMELGKALTALGRVVVHSDQESRGAWWNARRCWLAPAEDEPDATHVLVVHDDAMPTPGVVESVCAAVSQRPNEIVSFYSSLPNHTDAATELRRVAKSGWVEASTGCCGLATIMPVALARDFVEWCDRYIRDDWKADDTRIGLYAAWAERPICLTAPSLFQHPPDGTGVDGGANKFSGWVAKGPLTDWTRKVESRSNADLYLAGRRSKFINREIPPRRPA